jgi:4-amino-4-deoxy-L-arabinose transferase-like glycosyltransferase
VPGIVLFLAVALPWYVAVQLRNPDFFRVFILEHNLGRFGQDLYHHRQPFWFYLPVLLLSLMPWTIWLILAGGETTPDLVQERGSVCDVRGFVATVSPDLAAGAGPLL